MIARRKESVPGEFCTKLNEYISETDYSIYKLAQITDLGRTAIQNVLSGRLLPAKPFVERICAVLPITPRQKSELMELYLMDKIGKRAYSCRTAVKHIIETLPQYYTKGENSPRFGVIPPEITDSSTAVGIINVNNLLRSIIVDEIKREHPFISSTIPFDNTAFIDMTMHLLAGHDNIVFDHYMRLYKHDDECMNNMQSLEYALKFSMCKGVTYHPYYYYMNNDSADDYLAPYPYMLVTSEYSVLLSKDYNNAFVSKDKALHSQLTAHIKKLNSYSQLMIDVVDEKRMFDIFAAASPMYKYSIEFQPCLTSYVTPEIVAAKLKDVPGRENIIQQLENYFFNPEGLERIAAHEGICSFTKEGLCSFCKTGYMINLPGILLEQLSIEERIAFLEGMKRDASKYLLIDSAKLSVPSFMQVILLNNNTMLISCMLDEKNFCCVVTESGINDAFNDFFESMSDSDYLLKQSEMLSEIDSCIAALKFLLVNSEE